MKVFKAKLVKNKVNPFEVFDEADLDRNNEATKDELIKVLKNSISASNVTFSNEWGTYSYENIPTISDTITEKVETIKTETNDLPF